RVHLEKAIQLAHRTRKMVGILFIDLDAFKNINDAEGHEMGDRLLRRVASRLSGCVREHDTVARFGGDEFLVLLAQLNHHEEVLPIVERILTSFRQPFTVHNQEFFVTASVGIALYPADGETPHDLIKNADLAMYVAKGKRGDGYAFCSPEMKDNALTKKRLISGLYRALERKEFQIYYQPQVNARTGAIVGLEALLRWQHPEMGMVLPSTFIPIAEQTGIIISIGEWVLRTACAQVARWQRLGILPLRLAVNLSAVQIRDPELVEKVKKVLTETGFDPQYLELEITETTFFQDPEHVSATLRSLKNLGVNVTLDDFGTGYSFLTHLKALAVDRIKIDRHFLQGLLENSRDREIVKGIVHLAQSLEAQVTAEGVETEVQLEFLLEQGREEIQGYYYYRPLPPEELEGILLSHLRKKSD
ncbi:MAG: EAL domain-containing protein, partial [Candidatus Atribacteria bacterium]|nr:EAL domain-containing protein [Candidatus Atribacteria bacterium]